MRVWGLRPVRMELFLIRTSREVSRVRPLWPSCSRRQLIFPSQITGLENTEQGIEVHYRCWCGSAQTLLTGKKVDERLSAVA